MHDVQATLSSAFSSSIALTVTIAPSRRLRALLLAMALVYAGAAFTITLQADTFALPWLLAAACAIGAALGTVAAFQPLTARQIDISKAGALRLTVQQNLPGHGRAVRLLPGSLLWSRLLVLRLGSVDAPGFPVRTVLVLPDSTDPASFRALAVAMRAIAGRDDQNVVQKIL